MIRVRLKLGVSLAAPTASSARACIRSNELRARPCSGEGTEIFYKPDTDVSAWETIPELDSIDRDARVIRVALREGISLDDFRIRGLRRTVSADEICARRAVIGPPSLRYRRGIHCSDGSRPTPPREHYPSVLYYFAGTCVSDFEAVNGNNDDSLVAHISYDVPSSDYTAVPI